MKIKSRTVFLSAFILIVAILSAAFYYQFVENYSPCTLCGVQRFMFIFSAILLLVAIVHHPKKLGIRLYSAFVAIGVIGGIVMSMRQLWLQNLPPEQRPACGPGLNFLLENLPIGDALKKAFEGTADCAIVHWRLLGLSFAGWALLVFLLLLFLMGWQLLDPKR